MTAEISKLTKTDRHFVSADKFTHPGNDVMRIVSGQPNGSVGACARGVTVVAVIIAVILGITVNCLVILLISKSALTASLPMMSRRAQC